MIRPPKSLGTAPAGSSTRPTGADALAAEIIGEQAYALGLAEKSMFRALDHLAITKDSANDRHLKVQAAANAVHGYFIQREILGFSQHEHPIAFYRIPKDVLARVGSKLDTEI